MRVLVVHNRYRSAMPSGENQVVDDEVDLLRSAGIEVDTFFRDSDDIEQFNPLRKASLALAPTYSLGAVREFTARIAERRPDVVHLHNPFPLISPSVVRSARRAGIPVVQTVHNYRHVCPNGLFLRDGRVCTDCEGKRFPWPAVQHGCYRDSRSQSLAQATATWAHRDTWTMVEHFFATSGFVRDFLLRFGVPNDRVTIKPNSTADVAQAPLGDRCVYIGRLSAEKGIELLLEAWKIAELDQCLSIVGDGPLRDVVQSAAAQDPSIEWHGAVPHREVATHLAGSGLVVIPSQTFEGFPMLVAEAFAHGRPVLGSRLGSLSTIITNDVGWLAEPTPTALAHALRITASTDERRKRGGNARREYERSLTPSANVAELERVYGSLLGSDAGARRVDVPVSLRASST